MKLIRQQRVRSFSIIATLLMVFSLVTPAFAASEAQNGLHRSAKDTKLTAQEKVSNRLVDEFTDESDQVTFLVKFSDKAEVKKVAEEASNQANLANKTGQDAQLFKRSAILSELKTTSYESHKNVIAFLEEQVEAGTVTDYHSYNIVNGMAVTATKDVAEKIATFDEVEKLLKNETRELHTTTKTDEEAPQSTTEDVEWNVERINAPDVWDMGIDGTGTVVASLDSGTQWDHPALKEKYRGYDAATGKVDHEHSFLDATPSGKTAPYDDNGHGTHVTGTMVGSEPDGSNQVGVAPGAEWIAVKVFNAAGETSDAILLNGADWILEPGGRVDLAPDVVNNSWGGGPGLDEWYLEAVENWREYGIFPEFSAGNTTITNPGGPGSVAVPANYPISFATGATDSDDMVADFSLRGPSPYDEIKPDISAPGVNIRSSVPGSGYEGGWNGTSMSGPAVSAVATLLRQVNANITVDEMEEVLINTAVPRTDDEYDEVPNNGYGYGIVDANEAVSSILDGLGTIEGQVMQEGEDHEPPTYDHTPVVESYAGMDIELHVQAQDNISVKSVELHYENDDGETQVVEASRVSGTHTDGEYRAVIDGENVEGNVLTYKWVINDFSQNEVISDGYEVEIKAGITPGHVENFDEDPVGWHSFGENDYWEWGVPNSGPGSAYSGENVYATHLDGPYGNNTDGTLMMPPLELPDDDMLFLEFVHWYHFEESASGEAYDVGNIIISTDQKNWTTLQTVQGMSKGWIDEEIDLSDYAGERVFIGFETTSDDLVIRDGWYIDQVALYDSTRFDDDDEAPTFEHTPPSSTFIGTDLGLTIEVQDNARIKTVEAQYVDKNNEWNTVEAELQNGNYRSGTFEAAVPAEALTDETIRYRWKIEDYAENTVVSDEYVVQIEDHVTTGYYEDLQTKPDGWYSTGENDYWEWGAPTSGPESAYLGENVYATDLNDRYGDNMDALLRLPPMELPEDDTILFEFTHWHSFDGGYDTGAPDSDFGHVVISTNEEDWTELATFTGDSEGWVEEEVDLSDYAGQKVHIGFHATSDDGSLFHREGWYIDQVALYDSERDDDQEAPTFVHEAPSLAYEAVDLPLEINAQDNVKIETIELAYQDENNEWLTVEASLKDGNYRSGLFETVIPGEDITGETLTYQWTLEDHAGNQQESEEYVVDLEESITIGYEQDFEEKPVGWNAYAQYDLNDNWEWGVPTSGPGRATSGENVYATNLSGDYVNDMHSILVMPPVDLPEGEKSLKFQSWHSFEESTYGKAWDYGQVVISTDQEEWIGLEMFQGEAPSWEEIEVDLSDYSGRVYIGFRAYSDANGTYDGWYIDEVELTAPEENTRVGLGLMNQLDRQQSARTTQEKSDSTAITTMELPLGASVDVLESGRTVRSNPADGSYSMIHPKGDFTAQASAYGFESDQQSVTVEEDETSTANFTLEELIKGDIHGTVTDETTGDPIADAQVLLVEDANVDPVKTNEDGNFELTAYEGTYTLTVMARDYHSVDVEVTVEEGTVDLTVELEPYHTYPGGEIGYDDGTPDNARAFYDAGNGWGVKMSLPEGKDSAVVTDGVFQFWDEDFPEPGGTDFQVEVWDASGTNGTPGEKLAGPFDATAIRDQNEWTVVDLSEHNITVGSEFYMVYIQADIGDNSPGLASDETSSNAKRSYQYAGGSWERVPEEEGNYMIRSRVAYEVDEPVITTPEEDQVTNKEEITIEGTASPATTAQLLNNNEEIDTVKVDDNGEFSFTTTLSEGDNELSVVSLLDETTVGESEPVTVTLDTVAPELTIDNPADGEKSNRETVTVEGTVSDENLAYVEVNGQQADIDGDDYSKRILLDNGENIIEVTAVDEAGNTSTESITIDVKYDAPEISNLTPDEDMDLETGQSVKIEFDSEPGLRATFVVHMPLTDLDNDTALASNPTELPMMEMADGKYVGYWTVPANAYANGARIEVKAQDNYENETREVAEGKLFINLEK